MPHPPSPYTEGMTTPIPTSGPIIPTPSRCWTGPARGLLLLLAVPLGLACAAAGRPESAPAAPWPDLVVDANAAPVPVLEALPGLGPALAGRIAAARDVAPLRDLADLDRRVKGIGPAKAAGLRPFLRFDPPADAGTPAR